VLIKREDSEEEVIKRRVIKDQREVDQLKKNGLQSPNLAD